MVLCFLAVVIKLSECLSDILLKKYQEKIRGTVTRVDETTLVVEYNDARGMHTVLYAGTMFKQSVLWLFLQLLTCSAKIPCVFTLSAYKFKETSGRGGWVMIARC